VREKESVRESEGGEGDTGSRENQGLRVRMHMNRCIYVM